MGKSSLTAYVDKRDFLSSQELEKCTHQYEEANSMFEGLFRYHWDAYIQKFTYITCVCDTLGIYPDISELLLNPKKLMMTKLQRIVEYIQTSDLFGKNIRKYTKELYQQNLEWIEFVEKSDTAKGSFRYYRVDCRDFSYNGD